MELAQLRDGLRGKVVVVGVGNPLKGDDGLGPEIIARLRGKVTAPLFDCGPAPENFLGLIAQEKPDTVIVLDAADFSRRPGDIGVFESSSWQGGGFSTHSLSLRLFADLLHRQTGAGVYLVAIQPKQIGFGQTMSPPVRQACHRLERYLSFMFNQKN